MPSIDIERRLESLERENADLRARLKEIETHGVRKVILAPPVEERGVSITQIATTSGFVMPSEDELGRLANIVIGKHPWVGDITGPAFYGPKSERDRDWMKQYRASFKALGAFKRTEQPNHKVYLSWHISAVEAYLRTIRNFETLRGGPFLAAALAHGDIHYCLGKYPELGLNEHMGRDAGTAWKRVLETGRLLPESAPATRIEQAPSPVRVFGQGY